MEILSEIEVCEFFIDSKNLNLKNIKIIKNNIKEKNMMFDADLIFRGEIKLILNAKLLIQNTKFKNRFFNEIDISLDISITEIFTIIRLFFEKTKNTKNSKNTKNQNKTKNQQNKVRNQNKPQNQKKAKNLKNEKNFENENEKNDEFVNFENSWFTFLEKPYVKYEIHPTIHNFSSFKLNFDHELFSVSDALIDIGFESVIFPNFVNFAIPLVE